MLGAVQTFLSAVWFVFSLLKWYCVAGFTTFSLSIYQLLDTLGICFLLQFLLLRTLFHWPAGTAALVQMCICFSFVGNSGLALLAVPTSSMPTPLPSAVTVQLWPPPCFSTCGQAGSWKALHAFPLSPPSCRLWLQKLEIWVSPQVSHHTFKASWLLAACSLSHSPLCLHSIPGCGFLFVS